MLKPFGLLISTLLMLAHTAGAEDKLGPPIACTLQNYPDTRLVYDPEGPELSLRWTITSHDGRRKETTETIFDGTHASGRKFSTSTCHIERNYQPPIRNHPAPGYSFTYDCGDTARGELVAGQGTANILWTEFRLSGGFVDRREYVILRCW